MNQAALRNKIREVTHQDEHQAVTQLLHSNPLSGATRDNILQESRQLVTQCRADKSSSGILDAFLLEFGLSNAEGVALMCLAEALLRVPDALTADRLIAEKIKAGNWNSHRNNSKSLFVNASTWGLMLTGQLVSLDAEITENTDNWVRRLTASAGEPVIRAAVMQAMKIMGGQYVLGRNIKEGLKRGAKQNDPETRFSFDMLGEGARTDADARNYLAAYASAIDSIGQSTNGSSVHNANGISVKLSALHPRYYFAQYDLVIKELLPRIKQLCVQAAQYNIGLSIDAEEAYRLDISMDIFEALAKDSDLDGWQGLGFVLQAYQKRAPDTAKWLIGLARETNRRLMVRLVKGAYWDAEIKHAQELGLESYPVFTRKANTDLCYQHCAAILLDAQDAVFPQFATHNAYTASMILNIAGDREFEFQRLHGMGHILYNNLRKAASRPIPVRVYAPIGNHRDLLPYLVRRLLENGANSSFVNRFLDQQTPVEELLEDTRKQVTGCFPYQHKGIPVPPEMFRAVGEERKNAHGIDLDSVLEAEQLLGQIAKTPQLLSQPIIDGVALDRQLTPSYNPSNRTLLIGQSARVDDKDILHALESANQAYPAWNGVGHGARATILEKVADLMERDFAQLMGVISLEGGRTVNDGISEVREAIDFCRYYAVQARALQGLTGLGVFFCVSPWNFPLAITVGQIAAALAAGNTVLAKPAAQTPAIAAYAVRLFHEAGVPGSALQLLLGSGSQIGNLVLGDNRIAGIAFTGSTGTAQHINQQLALRPGKPIPFIAETGGQNCMVVDSSALPEQVVDDVIMSAFQSAGQRCSALRVLFIQSDIADDVLAMLKGAMASLHVGDPRLLSSDLGPVIDSGAQKELQAHIERMHREAKLIAKVELDSSCENGSFVAPYAFEIDSLDLLTEEVFGPILHVVRFDSDKLGEVLKQINNTGFGLTLGVHSRIQAFAQKVFSNTIAGNTYINRNMVGAVVGVNPFGGRGLSGTGPKAGGPNYLLRFSCADIPKTAQGSFNVAIKKPDVSHGISHEIIVSNAQKSLKNWQSTSIDSRLIILQQVITDRSWLQQIDAVAREKLANPIELPGPTGEDNRLSVQGRGVVTLIVTQEDLFTDAEKQIASALLCGCPVVVTADDCHKEALQNLQNNYLKAGLPNQLLQLTDLESLGGLIQDNQVEAIVANSLNADSSSLRQAMAKRSGSIIPLIEWPQREQDYTYYWLLWFLSERTRTENLVARGGNTKLFNLEE
ncbi:bifunctional proline dehydrogenase/L-glutamate gamma-semialdehyde dehydrogenase PutA [Porticoccaceae bacterium]|nr:bifunctional proline dehydrogenase/L-glutamate gamma-semialdehyde dehydrogenase PutA [Porticoccaceae bacterium]MDC1513003.1 bifunctional proline dehydrogenase/L-glutamate gamma-semialdehyde dehydrogenase PutA [Porticoccaceae bacterium]